MAVQIKHRVLPASVMAGTSTHELCPSTASE